MLTEEKRILSERLNKDLPDLEARHAKELSVFQTQLTNYKKTVEALKLELVNHSEAQRTAQAEVGLYKTRIEDLNLQMETNRRQQSLKNKSEREMLQEQIKLHKIQLEEITSKYVAASSVLESKESIERSLEQALSNVSILKQDNESLKSKLDDLSAKYSAAQSLIENSQLHERSMSSRIFDLEKSLSRVSGISINTMSEFNETTYQTFDEVAMQFQITKQRLDEKMSIEKQLFEKINALESDASKAAEELILTKQQLEEAVEELKKANMINRSYEKQLKDVRNSHDKWKGELDSVKETSSVETELFQGSLYFGTEGETHGESSPSMVKILEDKIEAYVSENRELQEQIVRLNNERSQQSKQIVGLNERLKKAEEESEQLKKGLAAAWEQCAEVEERLNQTLAASESCANESALTTSFQENVSIDRSDENIIVQRERMELELEKSAEKIDQLERKIAELIAEKESVLKCDEEMNKKLEKLVNEFEKVSEDKRILVEENERLRNKQSKDDINELEMKIHRLTEEKNTLLEEKIILTKRNEEIFDKHAKEISEIKSQAANELQKLKSLSIGLGENPMSLTELKSELESRHSREMEELRTYFEEKCLQMEKQYSEEVFSQQSKKMSDNDSEIEELTDDLYFGGGGDCLNVITDSGGKNAKFDGEIRSRINRDEDDNVEEEEKPKGEEPEKFISIQQELYLKVEELENLKSEYEKKLSEQQKLHENIVRELEKRTEKQHGFIKAVNQARKNEKSSYSFYLSMRTLPRLFNVDDIQYSYLITRA